MSYDDLPELDRPRRRAPRLRPQARRVQLLACALRVFARRGLGEARHPEVAREAGVSVSTVFVYFPTRSALRDAVLDEVERHLLEMAREVHERGLPAPEALLQHTRAFAASVHTHPDHARVWLDWSTAIRDEIWPRYLELQEQVVAMIARTLERGRLEGHVSPELDLEDEARLLVGSAHMLAQMQFTKVSAERVEHFIQTVVRAALGA